MENKKGQMSGKLALFLFGILFLIPVFGYPQFMFRSNWSSIAGIVWTLLSKIILIAVSALCFIGAVKHEG